MGVLHSWNGRHAGDAEEGLDMFAQELAAGGFLQQVARRIFLRQRWTVGPMRRQRIVDVTDADDLREQRHLVASKSLRISAAVEPLVMAPDDRAHAPQRLQRRAERVANIRV